MPFALVLVGLVMIVSGVRDTYKELGAELTEDFTGPNNFTYWVIAFGAVGALGYIQPLRGFSRMFMTLIIASMLLANQRGNGQGGFFENFMAAINMGPQAPSAPASPSSPGFSLGDLLSPNLETQE